jgi:hypothetical protein
MRQSQGSGRRLEPWQRPSLSFSGALHCKSLFCCHQPFTGECRGRLKRQYDLATLKEYSPRLCLDRAHITTCAECHQRDQMYKSTPFLISQFHFPLSTSQFPIAPIVQFERSGIYLYPAQQMKMPTKEQREETRKQERTRNQKRKDNKPKPTTKSTNVQSPSPTVSNLPTTPIRSSLKAVSPSASARHHVCASRKWLQQGLQQTRARRPKPAPRP